MRVVLFNGPARSGKSYLASEYAKTNPNAVIMRMTFELHIAALALCGLPPHSAQMIDELGLKDTPRADLDGRTPREVYIEYGNQIRRSIDEDYIANQWLKRAATLAAKNTNPNRVILVPDCRLPAEVEVACKFAGTHNVFLVRVYRPGINFANDVGTYLHHAGKLYDYHNVNGSTFVLRVVDGWLGR